MLFRKRRKAVQTLDELWRAQQLNEKKAELQGYDHKQHIGW